MGLNGKLTINAHVEFVFRKFLNFVKTSREIMRVDESEDSLTPVKAFWYPFEFDNSCKACCPFIKLDEVFGEWTCKICLHQTYGERRIMKHIEDNHEQPLHTCGKSEELTQDSRDFNNNGTRVTEVEPTETESDGFGAGTESLEIQEAIDPMHDQGSFNKTGKEFQAKRGQIRQVQRQQTLLYKHCRFNNGFQNRNRSMNRWKPRWNRDTGRGHRYRYQKPKLSKEELDAQLDSYMANRPKQSKDLQKALRDFRKTTLRFKAKFARSH